MNTRDKIKAWRLLAALEDMSAREAVLLGAGELEHVLELQNRMGPLVDGLSELAPAVADDDMRRAAMRLLDLRHKNHVRLGHELGRLNLERKQVAQTKVQLIRVGPAYGGRETRRVFQAQG